MKKGDIIVCINNKVLFEGLPTPPVNLTINKKYTIISIVIGKVMIINDFNLNTWYDGTRFIVLSEQREKKLKRILK